MKSSVSVLRNNYVRTLMGLWVRENRPEVFLACRKEAELKYPRDPKEKSRGINARLPESIRRIK